MLKEVAHAFIVPLYIIFNNYLYGSTIPTAWKKGNIVPILFVLYIQSHVSQIRQHSISVHLFADDIQIRISILPQHVNRPTSLVEICISDVRNWMAENKLQLNDDKTECLLRRPNRCAQTFNCTFLSVGHNVISFSTSAKILGLYFGDDMTIVTHVQDICRKTCIEI